MTGSTMIATMLGEFQREATTTRCVLERVPGDRLSWKPHFKSMSVGQLAFHIARIPAGISRVAQLDTFDLSAANAGPPDPASSEEILAAFDQSVADASAYFGSLTPEVASETWRMTINGNELVAMPRAGVLRTLLLNHWYHHRGQLSVYLRLLDIPVPVIYGRSADEGPGA